MEEFFEDLVEFGFDALGVEVGELGVGAEEAGVKVILDVPAGGS